MLPSSNSMHTQAGIFNCPKHSRAASKQPLKYDCLGHQGTSLPVLCTQAKTKLSKDHSHVASNPPFEYDCLGHQGTSLPVLCTQAKTKLSKHHSHVASTPPQWWPQCTAAALLVPRQASRCWRHPSRPLKPQHPLRSQQPMPSVSAFSRKTFLGRLA